MLNGWRWTFLLVYIFLQVDKTQDLSSKIWQTLGAALSQKLRRVIRWDGRPLFGPKLLIIARSKVKDMSDDLAFEYNNANAI
jgi:hypothetical protein